MNQPILHQSTSPETGETTRKQNLFEIGEELEQIFSAYEELDGEAAEEYVKTALNAYFEKVGNNLNVKIDGYCGLIKTLEAKADIRRTEAQRLLALARTDENGAERLRRRLKEWMEATGNQKLETTYHKVWTQNNGGQAPIVWLAEVDGEMVPTNEAPAPDCLPDEFVTVVPEQRVLNSEALRVAIASDEPPKFARFGSRGTSLRIK